MKFKTSDHYYATVMEMKGKFLGSVDGDAFRDAIQTLKEQGKTKLVVDLSGTDMIDSTGIGALIGALTSMRNAGGDVRIACLKKRIKNLFLMTRLLGPVFDDYDTVEEAVASYKESTEPA
ncbi:MAG: STAS domain-containing protein [Rhodothermales bacterium]|nr:STAS domain-containing protein [Rhodothermales bacterium]